MKKLLYAILFLILFFGISYFVIGHEPSPTFSPERNYITDMEDEIMSKFLLAKN